jgi:membrane protease YdiL (CAAX protease family)
MTFASTHQGGNLSAMRRRPVLVYFILAYLIAWGGVLLLVLPVGLSATPEDLAALFGPVFLAMALGPSLASVILTAILDGRAGLKALFGGLLHWRAGPRDYLPALLLVPATALLVLIAFASFSPVYTPALFGPGGGLPLLATGIVIGLAAGAFEELGWTGFAARRLLVERSVVATALLIGIPHGVWHLLVGYYWGEGASYGLLFVPYFIMAWIVALVALRLLIVWLFRHTESTLIAVLAHASYSGGLVMLWPTGTSPAEQTLWTAVFAMMLLGVVAALVWVRGTGDRPLTPRSSS